MLDFDKPVKLKKPYKGEETIIFKVVNINNEMKRCVIEPTNLDMVIKPLELVEFNEIENIKTK